MDYFFFNISKDFLILNKHYALEVGLILIPLTSTISKTPTNSANINLYCYQINLPILKFLDLHHFRINTWWNINSKSPNLIQHNISMFKPLNLITQLLLIRCISNIKYPSRCIFLFTIRSWVRMINSSRHSILNAYSFIRKTSRMEWGWRFGGIYVGSILYTVLEYWTSCGRVLCGIGCGGGGLRDEVVNGVMYWF